MKAVEILQNGKKLFTAGLVDGVLDVRLIIRNQEDPPWLDVNGRDRSTGAHARWSHNSVDIGDTFSITLVDVDPSEIDDPRIVDV